MYLKNKAFVETSLSRAVKRKRLEGPSIPDISTSVTTVKRLTQQGVGSSIVGINTSINIATRFLDISNINYYSLFLLI